MQTCIFFIIYMFLLGAVSLTIIILIIMEQPKEVLFYFMLWYFLGLDIVKSVIIPLIILKRSQTRLPQLFRSGPPESKRRQFYVRRPNISPRHQVRMAAMVSQENHLRRILVMKYSDS